VTLRCCVVVVPPHGFAWLCSTRFVDRLFCQFGCPLLLCSSILIVLFEVSFPRLLEVLSMVTVPLIYICPLHSGHSGTVGWQSFGRCVCQHLCMHLLVTVHWWRRCLRQPVRLCSPTCTWSSWVRPRLAQMAHTWQTCARNWHRGHGSEDWQIACSIHTPVLGLPVDVNAYREWSSMEYMWHSW